MSIEQGIEQGSETVNTASLSEERFPKPLRHGNRLQRFFLLFGVLFVLSLLASIIVRSVLRPSTLRSTESEAGLTQSSSQLHLQEFNRVQVKEGKPVWEIKAKDAKYFTQENITQVSQPDLLVHRQKDEPLRLKGKLAKLVLDGEALKRAEVEGSVAVDLNQTTTMKTESGTYTTDTQLLTAPGAVYIVGRGFIVQGKGMTFAVESEELTLHSDVSTMFEQGARPSKVLPRPSGSKR